MSGEHLYTLHSTYLGIGCAICGLMLEKHQVDEYQQDGKKVVLIYEDPSLCIGEMK